MHYSLRLFSIGLIASCTASTSESGSTARVRVAHLSPDAPAVDFCIAPSGTQDFTGPVLAGAGALNGVSYSRVTKYLEVEAQQYDVRLVNVGANDCSNGLGPDTTNLPPLPEGGAVTIAATGKIAHGTGSAAFQLRAYIDDAAVAAGEAKLRFIHASPGTPNVDVGLGGGITFTPVFSNTAYSDASEYLTTAGIRDAEVSARATGTTTDVIAIKPATLPPGKIATAFAIGELAGESIYLRTPYPGVLRNPAEPGLSKQPLGVLLCIDNAEHGLETECSVVGGKPERARVRVAHLSPDAPAIDVCIAKAGSAYPAQPLFASLGSSAGLSYPKVTNYLEIPSGAIDVRIVLAGATSCENKAVPDTNGIAVTPGLTATVGAMGKLADLQLSVFPDAVATGAGKAKLRFIHSSPGTPNVDIGIKDAHGTFSKLFANVKFGTTLGYLDTVPLTATVAARVANTTTEPLAIPNVSLAAGQIATAFAIGLLGSTKTPLSVLFCTDNATATSLLASCTVAH